MENAVSLYITRMTDTEMELSVVLRERGALTDDELTAMLALVPSLLPSRLALDADGRPILCRRIDVAAVDEALLEAHLLAVLSQAISLAAPDALRGGAPPKPTGQERPVDALDKLTFRP